MCDNCLEQLSQKKYLILENCSYSASELGEAIYNGTIKLSVNKDYLYNAKILLFKYIDAIDQLLVN